MGELIPIFGILFTFGTPVAIMAIIFNSPKAKVKAEIMRKQALAQLEDKRGLISAVKNEELELTVNDQQKRLDQLEDEVRFLRKLLDDRPRS
jgi:hypothetical protein